MVRPSAWQWRNDYFDPEMPIAVDLHNKPWVPDTDRIEIIDASQFWARRSTISFGGMSIPTLNETDRLAFAALHALRHIVRNDVKPAHVFEIGTVLTAAARRYDVLALLAVAL